MSTASATPPQKPRLIALAEQAGQALDDITNASEQYRQARLLYQALLHGQATADGILFYQPADGSPIQLPAPGPEILAGMLEGASAKLRGAVRTHWGVLQMSAEEAIGILDDAAAAEQAAAAAQFEQAEQPV